MTRVTIHVHKHNRAWLHRQQNGAVRLLLHAGCSVNVVNREGDSVLHLAVAFKPSASDVQLLRDVLEALLDGGAQTNEQENIHRHCRNR